MFIRLNVHTPVPNSVPRKLDYRRAYTHTGVWVYKRNPAKPTRPDFVSRCFCGPSNRPYWNHVCDRTTCFSPSSIPLSHESYASRGRRIQPAEVFHPVHDRFHTVCINTKNYNLKTCYFSKLLRAIKYLTIFNFNTKKRIRFRIFKRNKLVWNSGLLFFNRFFNIWSEICNANC